MIAATVYRVVRGTAPLIADELGNDFIATEHMLIEQGLSSYLSHALAPVSSFFSNHSLFFKKFERRKKIKMNG